MISPRLGAGDGEFDAIQAGRAWALRGGGVRALVDGRVLRTQVAGDAVSLRLTALGDRRVEPSPVLSRGVAVGNRVTFDDGDLREWYAAGPLGIEQGFVLEHRVGRAGGPAITLSLGGSARARTSGDQVAIETRAGRVILRYDGLAVVDARGRTIPARLRTSANRIAVTIDDRQARYPLRVDPLLHPARTGSGRRPRVSAPRWSVAVSRDRRTVLIGDPRRAGSSGGAWVFSRSAGRWAQQGPGLAGDGTRGSGLGETVALSRDGDTALVERRAGASGNGADGTRVYMRARGVWREQAVRSPSFLFTGTATTGGPTPLPPTCNDVSATTPPGGGSVLVQLSGVPVVQGTPLIYSIVAGPSHGTLGPINQQTGTVTFTSQPGYTGPDSFTYEAADPGGNMCAPAKATITIPPPAPRCTYTVASSPAGGGRLVVTLSCTGLSGSPVQYSILTGPAHGSLGAVNQGAGQVTYTPQAGYVGPDTFTFQGSTAAGSSGPTTVTLTVLRGARLKVSCTPSVFTPGSPTTCTVTVTDTTPGTPSTPTGTVTFTSSGGSFGHVTEAATPLNQTSCTLAGTGASASCSVSYTPTTLGTNPVRVSYAGDPTLAADIGSTSIASAPVAGVTAALTTTQGMVLVDTPAGGSQPGPATGSTISIPVGTTVDARKGTLSLVTAADSKGARSHHRRTQSALLRGAIFLIKQQRAHARARRHPVNLLLKTASGAVKAAHCHRTGAPGKGVVRSLTGVVKGLYATVGAASTATVQSGSYTVTDRCDGTLTSVRRGRATVTVGSKVHHGPRHVTLHAGQSYLARARLLVAKRGLTHSIAAVFSSLLTWASIDSHA